MRRYGSLLVILILNTALSGCAGSLFGGAPKPVSDMEEVASRRATAEEERRLDECLHHIFSQQKLQLQKHQRYTNDPRALDLRQRCAKMLISIEENEEGYTASAKIKDGEAVVRWSVNQTGEVVEHDDFHFDFEF